MWSLLAACVLASETFVLTPSDDFWIYSFAGDPRDIHLRVWGTEGRSVATDRDNPDSFSYSYLRFDLSEIPAGDYRVERAELRLVQSPGFGYTLEDTTAYPLEVRPVTPTFNERNWRHDRLRELVIPAGPSGIAGIGRVARFTDNELPVEITVDLLKGEAKFGDQLAKTLAGEDRAIALILTAGMDPAEHGRDFIYRVFSREGPEEHRPRLTLTLAKP